MIQATLADLRQSSTFFQTDDIIKIVNGRKKEEIGYFVPIALQETFENFLITLQQEKKKQLLQRIAHASKKDPIEEGTVDDGIK